jgi:transcriptional regulator
MYRPPAFREDRLDILHALIRAHPLAMLVTGGEHGLMASWIPFAIDPDASPNGTLRAHLAKGNGQVAALAGGAEAMILFQGPHAYVSPSWYASKREHGKVVPTWNYVTVHAWGIPCVTERPDWLRRQVDHLTDAQEQGRAHPWSVADAPDAFIAAQLGGIVGLEIPIARIEGAWKLSQNRSAADRQGVIDGLGDEGPAGEAVARLVAAAVPDTR